MKFEVNNEELEMILGGLRSDDDGCGAHEPSCKLADKLEALSLDTCSVSVNGKHFMVRPDDTETIQWGNYGICRCCNTIRRMP